MEWVMEDKREYNENSQCIQTHLGLMQSLIQRMAANSASCKTWCITLVSAILVLVIDKGKQNYALVAIIPTLAFYILDAYYLGMEKGFRRSYDEFVAKLHEQSLSLMDLFAVTPPANTRQLFLGSLRSFSVWLFYLTLMVMICIARIILE
jgi:hypothetical protein